MLPHSAARRTASSQPKPEISLVLLLCLVAVSFLPSLEALNISLLGYLKLLAIPLILGFLLGGSIDYFVPQGFIYRYLGRTGKPSLFYALAGGFLMSSCSHGILAIAIQIYRKGASIPAVITFLLASPWANFPVTILLISFFGWKGILFIVTAGFIAIVTGFIFEILERGGYVEKNDVAGLEEGYEWERAKNFSLRESVPGVLRGSLNLSNMVLWWLIVGLIMAVLIDVYVPGEFFMQYLGPDAGGLLLTLAGATVIEVCSEGSSLVAFEIYDKVGSFGNPFVFSYWAGGCDRLYGDRTSLDKHRQKNGLTPSRSDCSAGAFLRVSLQRLSLNLLEGSDAKMSLVRENRY